MNLGEAEVLAKELMALHGVGHWGFSFDWAVRRFGCCKMKVEEITLSRYLVELNDEAYVRTTMLHEIAHALTAQAIGWKQASKFAHGSVWSEMCGRVGIPAARCYGDDVRVPVARWQGRCPCGEKFGMWSRPGRGRYCRKCRGLIDWEDVGYDPLRYEIVSLSD